MNKFIPTFWLTFWKKVSSKSFIISTLIVILAIIALSNADKIYDFFDKSEDDITVITSEDKTLSTVFKNEYQKLDKKKKLKIVDLEAGKKGIKNEKYKVLIEIKENTDKTIESKVYTLDSLGTDELMQIQSTLTAFQSNNIAKSLNLAPDKLAKVLSQAKVDNEVIKPLDANDKVS